MFIRKSTQNSDLCIWRTFITIYLKKYGIRSQVKKKSGYKYIYIYRYIPPQKKKISIHVSCIELFYLSI